MRDLFSFSFTGKVSQMGCWNNLHRCLRGQKCSLGGLVRWNFLFHWFKIKIKISITRCIHHPKLTTEWRMQMVICEDRWCLTLAFLFAAEAGMVLQQGMGENIQAVTRNRCLVWEHKSDGKIPGWYLGKEGNEMGERREKKPRGVCFLLSFYRTI